MSQRIAPSNIVAAQSLPRYAVTQSANSVRSIKFSITDDYELSLSEFQEILSNPKGIVVQSDDTRNFALPTAADMVTAMENILGRAVADGDIFSIPINYITNNYTLYITGCDSSDDFDALWGSDNSLVANDTYSAMTLKILIDRTGGDIYLVLVGLNDV